MHAHTFDIKCAANKCVQTVRTHVHRIRLVDTFISLNLFNSRRYVTSFAVNTTPTTPIPIHHVIANIPSTTVPAHHDPYATEVATTPRSKNRNVDFHFGELQCAIELATSVTDNTARQKPCASRTCRRSVRVSAIAAGTSGKTDVTTSGRQSAGGMMNSSNCSVSVRSSRSSRRDAHGAFVVGLRAVRPISTSRAVRASSGLETEGIFRLDGRSLLLHSPQSEDFCRDGNGLAS
jgi:hypothetical protein